MLSPLGGDMRGLLVTLRSKFLDYAALYAQLADQSVRKEVLSKRIVFTETISDSLKPTGT